MKVLLISTNTETTNMFPLPLGLACVAAAVRNAGHDVRLIDLMFEGDTRTAISRNVGEFRPDVIGLSIRNIDDQNMQDGNFLLASLKGVVAVCHEASSAQVVLGGAGYTIFPESCLEYLEADLGVQGEGEAVMPAMLDRMAQGAPLAGLPGVCLPGQPPSARNFVVNLDDLPLPEPGLWIPDRPDCRDLWIPVQTRRGCPLDCSYCSTATIEGRAVRRRAPETVTNWLTRLSRAGHQNFNFVDNTFNLPQDYAEELCRALIQAAIGINWWCIVYPKWVDRRLVELMAKAGCRQVSFGFESGSTQVLRSLNKQFQADEVRAISEMFRDAGIERRGFLLLGGPGETKDTVEESLDFADSLKLDYLKVTAGLRIYPRTQLARVAREEGVIDAEDDLLMPRFYLAPELREWLPERVNVYKASRPWVV